MGDEMSTLTRASRLSLTDRAREAAVNAGQQVMAGFEWWLLRSSEIPVTPFLGRELRGRVTHTLLAGRVIYQA